MRLILLFLIAIFWYSSAEAACTGASPTFTAASPASADIAACQTLATTGDTIIVPAGSATYSSQLDITKCITIQGAGAGVGANGVSTGSPLTVLTVTTGAGSGAFRITLAVDCAVRITGFHFTRTTAGPSDIGILLWGKRFNGTGVAQTQIRIDHNRFTNGGRCVSVNGWSYGVIDNNRFQNCNIAVDASMDGGLSWARSIAAGTSNAIFIETNTFYQDNTALQQLNESVYHGGNEGGGNRSVTRYNIWDTTAYTSFSTDPWETHGNYGGYWNGVNSQPRGLIIGEFYNNTINMHHGGQYILHIRGGSVLAHDNTITTVTGTVDFVLYDEEETRSSGCGCLPLRAGTAWPAQDGAINNFFWNNTINGVTVTSAKIAWFNPESQTIIAENRDFFMHAPQATGGRADYTGARNGGSQSTPTESDIGNTVFTAGVANAYYPYTPYTYPHPLTGTADTTPPAAPTGLTISRLLKGSRLWP